MYHVSAQGVDERMIIVHYYYLLSLFLSWSVRDTPGQKDGGKQGSVCGFMEVCTVCSHVSSASIATAFLYFYIYLFTNNFYCHLQ